MSLIYLKPKYFEYHFEINSKIIQIIFFSKKIKQFLKSKIKFEHGNDWRHGGKSKKCNISSSERRRRRHDPPEHNNGNC